MTAPGPAAGAGGGRAGPAGRLRALGPLAARRPPPSLAGAMAGVGGALVAGGLIAVAGDWWASSGSTARPVVVTGSALASGAVAQARAGGPARAAAVAASGLAAPALAFFLNAGGGIPSLRGTALVAGALLAALYLVGPGRGHTFHLAVLAGAGWLFALSVGHAGLGGSFAGGFGTLADVVAGAGLASMATGVAYLGAGAWLHARGLEGMATPLLAVGAVALPLGTVGAVEGDVAVGALVALGGAAVAAVGGLCRRRGTTWTGVAVGGAGIVAVAVAVGSGGVVVPAAVVVGAGLALVGLSPPVAAAVGEERGAGGGPS